MSLFFYVIISDPSATVISRKNRDAESYRKDFSLSLEMTVWTDFRGLFELLSAEIHRSINRLIPESAYPISHGMICVTIIF